MAPAHGMTVEEDYEEAGGHAILTVPHDGPPPPGLRLGFRRFGFEDGHLGPRGWQGPECLLASLGVEAGDGVLLVRLGPAIVDHIDPHTPVEITIPAIDARAVVHWPEIDPATGSGGSAMRMGVAPRTPPPAASPPPAARPQGPAGRPVPDDPRPRAAEPVAPAAIPPPPPPPPEPPVTTPATPTTGPAAAPASAVVAPTVPAPKLTEPVTTAPPPNPSAGVPGGRTGEPTATVPIDPPVGGNNGVGGKDDGGTGGNGKSDTKPRRPWIAGAAAALAAVVLAAVLLAPGLFDGGSTRTTEGPTPAPEPAPAPAPAPPAPVPAPPPSPPPALPPTSPIERARAVMERTTDPKAIYDEAMTMLRSGDADTAFLLFEQAELRDYGPASTAIGAMRDPSRFDRGASAFDKPNPRRALDDYRRARDRGDPAAEEAIAKLRQWLEAAASRGDAEARRILEGGV